MEAAEKAVDASILLVPSDKVSENPAIAKAKKALQSFLLKFESLDQDFKEDPKFEQASNNLRSAKQKGTFHALWLVNYILLFPRRCCCSSSSGINKTCGTQD